MDGRRVRTHRDGNRRLRRDGIRTRPSVDGARVCTSRRRGATLGGDSLARGPCHGDAPLLVGGSDRFDSALIEATDGHVIAKIGAEGVHSIAIIDDGIGIAIKVEDGAQRAQFPAVLSVLQQLGALPRDLPPRLAEFMHRPLRNTRGEIVGEIRSMVA